MKKMIWKAKWIRPAQDMEEKVPFFLRKFCLKKRVERAKLFITAMGVYEACLNGDRVGKFILAPGWTSYTHRLQYQEYDVTSVLKKENTLTVAVGPGWYRGRGIGLCGEASAGLLAQLEIVYRDGTEELLATDGNFLVSGGCVRFSEIYDGEIYDAGFTPKAYRNAEIFDGPYETLIPQQGEEVREQERIEAADLFITPKGETVIDFGQEITGYVNVHVKASAGDVVDLSFGEFLDREGNFYNANYRSAKALYRYICVNGEQSYRPRLTFWGFRYVRINAFPGGTRMARLENFTAVVLHSEMVRTGEFQCSNPLLNRLFSNIIWSQKGNFLDIPTDCPQRDERLGWTGDAQVFARTACLNYDVEKFFKKWLCDVSAEQTKEGAVNRFVPNRAYDRVYGRAAWGDAAVICPWEVFMAYGDMDILEKQYSSMCGWINYITKATTTPYLWTGGIHNGDWLALDSPEGSYKGASRDDLIATAFYAYSTQLVIRAGKLLNHDVSFYESLYEQIIRAFRTSWPIYYTQTECVLAAHFGLAPNPAKTAEQLAKMVEECGVQLRTGFVGTPYLLHVLSDYGYGKLAWSLLLREEYPSWLYPVKKGATTVWEHWDSIREDGSFWSDEMNSFNHYGYGSVGDWLYGKAAGILPETPGYSRVRIAPMPDPRLDYLEASLMTRHGIIRSKWRRKNDFFCYDISVPVDAVIVIAGKEWCLGAGAYRFYSGVSMQEEKFGSKLPNYLLEQYHRQSL